MRINQNTRDYFAVGDRDDLSYEEKLAAYDDLASDYFQADEFADFCAEALPHLEEVMTDYIESPEFGEDVLVRSIRLEVEADRQEEMIERCRSLVGAWAADSAASR
jgi:hypothetical protein